jgi:predicted nucleic acid-binding protein
MPIDVNVLYGESAMLDSSVLVPALRRGKGDETCAELFDALVDARRNVLIAAPSWAELLRRSPAMPTPRTRYVRVVAFDLLAAEALAKHFTPTVVKSARASGARGALGYYKYDVMIIACGIRHKVDGFITLDPEQGKQATAAGLRVHTPDDFLPAQLSLIRT